MTDLTRNLLTSLASHMAYMQGQLQARHDPDEDDLEDCYWYAESVALRQMVSDALAGEPAAVTGRPSDGELLKLAQQYSVVYLRSDGSACHPFQEGYDMRSGVLNFARAVLAHWGNPAPQLPADGEVPGLVEMLNGIAYWKRHGKPGEPAPTSFDIRQADRLDRAAELLQWSQEK